MLNTGVYNGEGAAIQGEYGKGLTGYATDLVGATDPKTTQRHDRYNQIMNTVAADDGGHEGLSVGSGIEPGSRYRQKSTIATKEAKQQALEVILKKAQLHAQVSEEAVKSLKAPEIHGAL